MVLVMNLKGAIGNLNDEDINIKIDKGVVYIDISDKLLFKSGRYEVTPEARMVLGKVAQVLKNQPDLEFMVEGHTGQCALSQRRYFWIIGISVLNGLLLWCVFCKTNMGLSLQNGGCRQK